MRYSILIILLLLPMIAQAQYHPKEDACSGEACSRVYSAAENACYYKAYDKTFTPPVTELRHKVIRGKKAREIKQCSSVYCLLKTFPKSRRRLLVVYKRRGKGYVTFGNLGWTGDVNMALIRKDQLNDALLVAAGVEKANLSDPERVESDLKFHDRFAWENRCIRKALGKGWALSFNEVVVLD